MTNRSYGKDWNCLNLSSEWSKLIKEAAKCDAYCSDILISYDAVIRQLNSGAEKVTEYFGFRDYGVDHDTFIKSRLSEYKPYRYRKIYKLTISCGEIQNYEGYRDWTAELSDISDMKAEDIIEMINND